VPSGHVLFAHAAVVQNLERAKLVERMQADAFVILGERIILSDTIIADHTGDGFCLGHPLLLHR
jgi:hypothetical protein